MAGGVRRTGPKGWLEGGCGVRGGWGRRGTPRFLEELPVSEMRELVGAAGWGVPSWVGAVCGPVCPRAGVCSLQGLFLSLSLEKFFLVCHRAFVGAIPLAGILFVSPLKCHLSREAVLGHPL